MAEAAFKKSQREAGGKTNKETIKKLIAENNICLFRELLWCLFYFYLLCSLL